jgi:cell division ATPase FtsA
MSHIQRLKEIRVNLLGTGLTRVEGMMDSLIADMEEERTSIDKAMDKLATMNKAHVSATGEEPTIMNIETTNTIFSGSAKANDINGKILASKLSWSE